MREILFRGKLLATGEWAYGCLKINPDKSTTIITPDDTVLGKYGRVRRDTVGQYIELTDKNETKIFEGDICKIDGEDGLFEVAWDGYNARFKLDGCGITADFDSFYERDIEVVGNIHDNQELLEVME